MTEYTGLQLVPNLPHVPKRNEDAHKGDFGRAFLIAGSRGMSGAACLAAKASLRGGAGLVTVAVPNGIVNSVASFEPSYLTLPLPEDEQGRFSQAAAQLLAQAIAQQSAVGIGPGLGQSATLLEIVSELYGSISKPSVFDADALNLLAKRTYVLKRGENAPPRILTPHVGEFARLTGLDLQTIQENRVQIAAEFARKYQVIIVLKGAHTIISDGVRCAINATGNSGMATGGTGDVLTGVITALLAQEMPAFEAAHLGVHVHGLAGDLAAETYSKPGMIASDLLHFLGRAWCELDV